MADAILASRPCRRCGILFTGVRCKPCQMAQRKANADHYASYREKWRTANKEHIANYGKNYHAENSEQISARNAGYRKAHPDLLNKRYAEWAAANPEKRRRNFADWVAANPDKQAARLAEYRAAHPEQVAKTRAEWNASNPQRVRVHRANRRGREATGKLSTDIIERLMVLQRGKCACCGKSLDDGYHLDHIEPLAKGGLNVDSNMQLLTPKCNAEKHTKHPIEFMQERGFLL